MLSRTPLTWRDAIPPHDLIRLTKLKQPAPEKEAGCFHVTLSVSEGSLLVMLEMLR